LYINELIVVSITKIKYKCIYIVDPICIKKILVDDERKGLY
jgi:hypothetical protein